MPFKAANRTKWEIQIEHSSIGNKHLKNNETSSLVVGLDFNGFWTSLNCILKFLEPRRAKISLVIWNNDITPSHNPSYSHLNLNGYHWFDQILAGCHYVIFLQM